MSSSKTAQILDGRAMAEKIKLDLYQKISPLEKRPGLAAILVGDDPSSELYVRLKEKACEEVGINFHKYLCNNLGYPRVSQAGLLEMINFLNQDRQTDGILVQLPLPQEFNTQEIINAIAKEKDVDGFNYPKVNIVPPAVSAIIELIKTVPNLNSENKKVLAIIKSPEFAMGLKLQLKALGFKNITQQEIIPPNSADYDVIIIALGQAHALKKSMIKKDAIIIDVGINKVNNKAVGDVDPSAAEVTAYLSPVPGGVGPLTVACLLRNTYILSETHEQITKSC